MPDSVERLLNIKECSDSATIVVGGFDGSGDELKKGVVGRASTPEPELKVWDQAPHLDVLRESCGKDSFKSFAESVQKSYGPIGEGIRRVVFLF